MSTRVFMLALGALLASAPALAPAKGGDAKSAAAIEPVESVLTMSVDGRLVIEKDGSVGEFSISTPLTEGIAPVLDKAIRGWRFQPVLIDGALVRAESRMRISLAATKLGEDYQVRIENVVFPKDATPQNEDTRSESGRVAFLEPRMKPPVYPSTLERAGVSGRVLVGLRIGTDGRVQDAVAVQSMLFNVEGRDRAMAMAIRLLEENALQAARRWSVTLRVKDGETLTPKDLTAFTTIEYVLDAHSRNAQPAEAPAGKWRLVSRTPKRAMPWLVGEKDVQDVGVADVQGGEMLPIAGAPRLLSPINQTLL